MQNIIQNTPINELQNIAPIPQSQTTVFKFKDPVKLLNNAKNECFKPELILNNAPDANNSKQKMNSSELDGKSETAKIDCDKPNSENSETTRINNEQSEECNSAKTHLTEEQKVVIVIDKNVISENNTEFKKDLTQPENSNQEFAPLETTTASQTCDLAVKLRCNSTEANKESNPKGCGAVESEEEKVPMFSKAMNRPSFKNRLLKNAKGIFPIQLQMKDEGLCILINKERIVPELLDNKHDEIAAKNINCKERIQRIKEYILGDPLKYVIMEEERRKINTKKLTNSKETTKTQVNIMPINKILLDNGRSLRSRGLSPCKYNKYGNVKKRIDAPHYSKTFSVTHPYIDKAVSVSIVEEKPQIEQIKELFSKEVYSNLHKFFIFSNHAI